MKLAESELEKESYSGLARFMMLTVPILFVIVMLGVLFTLFDADIRNRVLQTGQSIPVIKDVLPKPKVAGNSMDDNQIRTIKMTEKIEELQAELSALENELSAVTRNGESQERTIKELETENQQLKRLNEEQLLEDEEYNARIQELAGMFSRITPGKAAPILQNMELEEIVLLFASMRADDRVRIMEKMNPKIAAEAAIMLKDTVTVKDMQIAALQSRLKKNEEEQISSSASSVLDQEQLGATFAGMDTKSAGELLLKMEEISPSKVLRVLNSVSDQARSAILTEMSKKNEAATAKIVSKLMAGS